MHVPSLPLNIRRNLATAETWSSGMLAQALGSSSRTAATYMDNGVFPGCFRVPGSNHRRIRREDALRALRSMGIATEPFTPVHLHLGPHAPPTENGVPTVLCEDSFALGEAIREYWPDGITVDAEAFPSDVILVVHRAIERLFRAQECAPPVIQIIHAPGGPPQERASPKHAPVPITAYQTPSGVAGAMAPPAS